VCWGLEYNQMLVDTWLKWSSKLVTLNPQVWKPLVDKISLAHGNVRQHDMLPHYLRRASLVLCWNSCFTVPDDIRMFELVDEHMAVPDAVLVVGTRPVTVPGRRLQQVALSPAVSQPNAAVTYCMNSTRGKLTGNHLKDKWFSWFKNLKTPAEKPLHGTRKRAAPVPFD